MTAAKIYIIEQTLENARDLVKKYNDEYDTNFELDKEYSLYPDKDCEYGFRNCQPFYNKGGVYLILDENKNILYVGQTKYFGSRFYYYFKADQNGNCIPVHNWTKKPYAIVAIPTIDEKKYERLSLEEYLIQNLQPADNTLGK